MRMAFCRGIQGVHSTYNSMYAVLHDSIYAFYIVHVINDDLAGTCGD